LATRSSKLAVGLEALAEHLLEGRGLFVGFGIAHAPISGAHRRSQEIRKLPKIAKKSSCRKPPISRASAGAFFS
jgi:hypothetical protein